MTKRIKKLLVSEDNLFDLAEQIHGQMKDDRDKIKEIYDQLKQITNNTQDYAVNGQTLAKFAELMSKQTGQLVEYFKFLSKDLKDDERENNDYITPEEAKDAYEKIIEQEKKSKK